MWRTLGPIVVLVAALIVLLVPFHPEAVVLNAAVAVSPHTPFAYRVDWFLVESGGNFAMFAVLGAAARLLLRRAAPALASAWLLSAMAEIAQLVVPNRVASWTDFATNALGAFVGVTLTSVITARLRQSQEAKAQRMEHGGLCRRARL